MKDSSTIDLLVILPSLRISGGVQEALRLALELMQSGLRVQVLSLWHALHEVDCGELPVDYLCSFTAKKSTALFQYPWLLIKFKTYLDSKRITPKSALLLTHYSTFPFAWLTPSQPWYCFNQDIEWMFVPPGLPRALLRWLILSTCRRAQVITTNSFIESLYEAEGIFSLAQASIWASDFWEPTKEEVKVRDLDLAMVVRRGAMKRLDLYQVLLQKMEGRRCAVICSDVEIHSRFSRMAEICLLRPSNEAMKNLYRTSKIFVSLSDTEGFGLTPLEAMGQGCVPVCRDSGGVRCYLTGAMQQNLIPREEPLAVVTSRINELLGDAAEVERLSNVAKTIFEEGAHQSRLRRDAAIVQLSRAFDNQQPECAI